MSVVTLRLSHANAKALDGFLTEAMDNAACRLEGAVEEGNMADAKEALNDRNVAHAIRYELSRLIKETA